MKKKLIQLFSLLLVACGIHGQDFDKMLDDLLSKSVPMIEPDALQQLKDQKSVVILDAREEEEYRVSHLPNAQWVGYKNFDISKVHADKDAEIIVYCSVGYRSEKIGEQLEEAGYTNVKNLYGGIFNWKNSGHNVVDQSNKKTEKVHAYNKSWGKWLKSGEKVYE